MLFLDVNEKEVKNTEDFQRMLDSNKSIFVLVHMIGCGPCKMTLPEWLKLKNDNSLSELKSNDDIIVAHVEQSMCQQLHSEHLENINSFPTIKYFKGNTVEDYNGDRTVEAFAEWIISKVGDMSGSKLKDLNNINVNNSNNVNFGNINQLIRRKNESNKNKRKSYKETKRRPNRKKNNNKRNSKKIKKNKRKSIKNKKPSKSKKSKTYKQNSKKRIKRALARRAFQTKKEQST